MNDVAVWLALSVPWYWFALFLAVDAVVALLFWRSRGRNAGDTRSAATSADTDRFGGAAPRPDSAYTPQATAPPPPVQTPQPTGTTTNLSSDEAERIFHEAFPALDPSRVHVSGTTTVSTSSRVLTGDEAQHFLHDTGLDRTVEQALRGTGFGPMVNAALRNPTAGSGTFLGGTPVPAASETPEAFQQRLRAAQVCSGKSSGRGWLTLLGMLAVLTLGIYLASHGCSVHPAKGTVTSTAQELGEWTMHVDTCHTGAKRGFYGAQLYDSTNDKLAIWMVEDPLRGLVASVNSTTSNEALNLGRDECAVLKGGIHPTGTSVNRVTVVEGSWDMQCTLPSGGTVSGHFESSHCL